MERKATSILKDIMQKLSMIDTKETKEETETVEDTVEVAEEVVEVKEEVQLKEDNVQETKEVELMEGYVKEEVFNKKISELMNMINSMKEEMSMDRKSYKDEKEQLNSQIEKLSKEPAVDPIKEQSEVKKEIFKFAQRRPVNTLDRVISKITN